MDPSSRITKIGCGRIGVFRSFSISIWGADTVLSKVVGFYFKLING